MGQHATLRFPIMEAMNRPCFLVIDREYSGSISTRKLVIETAKFNVITAYSAQEGIDTIHRFPSINGIVLDAGIRDMPCNQLIATLKQSHPQIPLIVINAPGAIECPGADHQLESFDPRKLLGLLQTITPNETAAIEARNEALSDDRGHSRD
jgi:DNA-binding NtrC family response regulator